MLHRFWTLLLGLALACLGAAGCAPPPAEPLAAPREFVPEGAIAIPASRAWTDSGVDVRAGQAITISATGRIEPGKFAAPSTGPEGTFLYDDALHDRHFPMPAAGRGPAPCWCLIGRIGHGAPFFIGRGRSWVPEETGRLWLGVNDFDVSDNAGEFYAEVTRPDDVQPVSFRTDVPLASGDRPPPVQGRVVVIYVDGLRPDVVEEMAAMGHLPHIRRHFIEGGTWLRNTFSAFPSDTITSNGTMWTGCFSDRHGIKGQIRFSRKRLKSESFLEPMGPTRTARQLSPEGMDRALLDAEAGLAGLLHGPKAAERVRQRRTSDTPALSTRLQEEGEDWGTGVLPVMNSVPPLWTRSMARCLPYLDAQEAWKYMDDANAAYAVKHLLGQPRPVTVVWMPETDSVSHKECRGQFGSTRRTIARADALLGNIVAELEGQGRLDETFLVLVSDHGHHGGQAGYLRKYDLTNELLYEPRQIDAAGTWVGGGFGLSVRQHRFANTHAGDGEKEFVFIDGDSDGTARLFFPRGHYRSRDWSGPNSPADLLAYGLSKDHPPVNLPLQIAESIKRDSGRAEHPIDLVLMRTGPHSILITTCDRGQAVIDRRQDKDGHWLYRYSVVKSLATLPDGNVAWKADPAPATDPLGLVERAGVEFLQKHHTESTWLWVTAGTEYPDSVVALTRHMLWQDNLREQEREYAADLVVTARPGWLFAQQSTPGTTHGYPLAESMRATWYVSGPGVRRGARVERPCRLADLTPTLLELSGVSFDAEEMDGRALRTIYEPDPNAPARPASPPQEIELTSLQTEARDRAMYWSEVDLTAWHEFEYRPDPPYADLPKSMNRPDSGWDLNNIAYNAMSIGDWSVLRLADDALAAVSSKGKPPASVGAPKGFHERLERLEDRAERSKKPWVAEGVRALNLSEVSVKDYGLTSGGNLQRMDDALDWLQDRETVLDRALARPWGRRSVLASRHTNTAIDRAQKGFWDVYRFGQRVMAELLDETVLNGVENAVDASLNAGRATPSEVRVK